MSTEPTLDEAREALEFIEEDLAYRLAYAAAASNSLVKGVAGPARAKARELARHHETLKWLSSHLASLVRDAERLQALEAIALNVDRVGNGVAIFPFTTTKTGVLSIGLTALGDQDGSDLDEEISAAPTLREAIDRASSPEPAPLETKPVSSSPQTPTPETRSNG